MTTIQTLSFPLNKSILATLQSGDALQLSGTLYTMRDAGHRRCLDYLDEHGTLPFELEGQTLFYAGPTPPLPDQPFGSIGPTTASRMDFATPRLMEAGIVATIGKGKRSEPVREACMHTGGVYFACIGGIAALLAQHVTDAVVVAWEDLGTEALHRIEVTDFPVYVDIDTKGNRLYT